jgi:hypothetical protein
MQVTNLFLPYRTASQQPTEETSWRQRSWQWGKILNRKTSLCCTLGRTWNNASFLPLPAIIDPHFSTVQFYEKGTERKWQLHYSVMWIKGYDSRVRSIYCNLKCKHVYKVLKCTVSTFQKRPIVHCRVQTTSMSEKENERGSIVCHSST